MENIVSVGNLCVQETDLAIRPSKVREFAADVHRMGDVAKIALAASWKEIRDGEYWKEYGFQSFDSYVFEEFSYGKSTSDALIGIYETYVTKLGVNPNELISIPWFGLKALRPHVNQSNVLDVLSRLRGMSQKEIKAWVKDMQGLHNNETVADKKHTFRFTCDSEEQAEVFRSALKIAEETSGSQIPAENVEFIAANFLLSHTATDNNTEEELSKWVARLEKMFKVKITWKKIDQFDEPEDQDDFSDLIGDDTEWEDVD